MSKLKELLNNIKNNHVYIQTHNDPDPDAIASGFGLKYLLEKNGIKATLCYGGKIERFNVLKMIELFEIEIINIKDTNIDKTDEIILVDTQKGNGNIFECNGNIISAIDHHPTCVESSYLSQDIRDDVGACASIIASYFLEEDIEMPQEVAEALLFGIKIDTANMTRGVVQVDLDVFYALFNKVDKDKLTELENCTLRFDDLSAYTKAISSLKIVQNVCFADIGDNCQEALIAIISDFLYGMADVEFAVVCSTKNNGIKLSVRGDEKYFNANRIILRVLDGIGDGGGHGTMAGGFAPFTNEINNSEKMMALLINRFGIVIKEQRKHKTEKVCKGRLKYKSCFAVSN